MRKYIRIGVDIAKNCFQVHALESEDCSATKRKLSRSGIVKFLAEVEPCAIGMEACGSAHYWARRFRAMGHEVKLTPPIYVKAYVKRGKNDARMRRRSARRCLGQTCVSSPSRARTNRPR
jgi:transposase